MRGGLGSEAKDAVPERLWAFGRIAEGTDNRIAQLGDLAWHLGDGA